MMNLLSARWFRALAVIVLLVLLLWMSSNRIVVMLGNQYFEPTYQLCIDTLGLDSRRRKPTGTADGV
ncbi:MAG: hypothetical protein CM15mP120_29280 [Pseudomonadota bacterium]|nr:MAG: hypothetical protein CM15mP120_29280 [Pseudomonadota bacterium]